MNTIPSVTFYSRLTVLLIGMILFTSRDNIVEAGVTIEPAQVLLRQTTPVNAGGMLAWNFTFAQGSSLIARFQVVGGLNNSVKVWLLDVDNFQKFQKGLSFSYYKGTSGTIRNTGNYTFPIPKAGIYYLVIDNREALLLPRSVNLYVYVLLPTLPAISAKMRDGMEAFYQSLRQVFIFEEFTISYRHCGLVNAFSDPNVTMCFELMQELWDKGLNDAHFFVLLHELGHTFLRLWGYPLWDNEDVADEFGTVLSIILEQNRSALEAASWWANQTSEQEAVRKIWLDDRHTLSPQRARNIIRWSNQPNELSRKWQKFLVPNMQTKALRGLDVVDKPWVDHVLVRAELARRIPTQDILSQQTIDPQAIVSTPGRLKTPTWLDRDLIQKESLLGKDLSKRLQELDGKYEQTVSVKDKTIEDMQQRLPDGASREEIETYNKALEELGKKTAEMKRNIFREKDLATTAFYKEIDAVISAMTEAELKDPDPNRVVVKRLDEKRGKSSGEGSTQATASPLVEGQASSLSVAPEKKSNSERSMVERFQQLKEARDRGLISEEEYQSKRKQILEGL